MNQPCWYVLYTYPNSEKATHKELGKRSITSYLPVTQVVRQWSDRKKKLEVPLFPNYVFVNIAPANMWKATTVNGVVRFISFNGVPAKVKDEDIDVIRKLLSGQNDVYLLDLHAVGDKVRVKEGPLAGLVGRVLNRRGMTRLHIELETVHHTIAVDIDAKLLDFCAC